jgi:transcriptional regulator with XRE-family HTH domain
MLTTEKNHMDTDLTNLFVRCQQTQVSDFATKYFVVKETLADRVAQRMHELNWGQAELARRVGHGVKQQNIQQLLAGVVKRPLYDIYLASALGVTLDWLLTGRGQKYASGCTVSSLTTEQFRLLSSIEDLLERFEALPEADRHLLLKELHRRRMESALEAQSEVLKPPSLPDSSN